MGTLSKIPRQRRQLRGPPPRRTISAQLVPARTGGGRERWVLVSFYEEEAHCEYRTVHLPSSIGGRKNGLLSRKFHGSGRSAQQW